MKGDLYMRIQKIKIIETREDLNLDITGITLLSIEEAEEVPENIRDCGYDWWLRSPGYSGILAACVYGGHVYNFNVKLEFGVRPALKFNPSSANLQIGDSIKMFGYNWTIITDNLMLCDDIVGKTVFREDWEAKDANDYEASDIKKWLENWYAEQLKSQAA